MLISQYLQNYGGELITCAPGDTARKVAGLISKGHLGAIPVCDEKGNMVGIVSERDLVRKLDEVGGEVEHIRVEELMTRNVHSCRPDQPMADVRELMFKHGFRHVPILEDYKVIGVVSVRDALRVRLDQQELEANVLKDTIIAARNR